MMNDDPRLQAALGFARRGWPVFPVTDTKLPAIKAWEQSATTDEEQIRRWFTTSFVDGCNFGFPPGRAGVLVIDTDRHHHTGEAIIDGEDSLRSLLIDHAETLPETLTVRTPSGGLHRYYLAAGMASKNAYLPAVDVKSGGGYVVIPGSVSQKGAYVIEKDVHPAPAPSWFLGLYNRRKKAKETRTVGYNIHVAADTPEKITAAERIIDTWPEAVEGERNDSLYRMARELCKLGVSRNRALELYAERGIERIGLDPDAAEVAATVQSAYGQLDDFGAESREARERVIALLDDLPPLEGEGAGSGKAYSDGGGQDWATLAKREVPPRRWFIEDWLSADAGYTVLFTGRGGTGKSSIMLDLAYSLATKEPFAGREVLRGSKTMLVSCEDSEEEITRRIQQRKVDHTRVPSGVIRVWPRSGKDNVLCAPNRAGILQEAPFMAELRERAKAFFGSDGGVLILDTLSDIFAGNENDRAQVSQFVKRHINHLGQELGVTIIILAHPAKALSTTGQGFSGSTAWEGAFRCRWELNYRQADRVDGLLELVLAKSNTAKAGRKIVLENNAGLLLVVDEARADNAAKDRLWELIADAHDSGSPYGRGKRSARPVESARIADPVTGEFLTEKEIETMVSEMLAEGRIEMARTNRNKFLKPVGGDGVPLDEENGTRQGSDGGV